MRFAYQDLTVVGFNGTAEGECGYAVAVARHATSGKYIKLSFPPAELTLLKGLRKPGEDVPPAPDIYTPAENVLLDDEAAIRMFEDRGRLTLFPKGVKFPARHTSMVLYVRESFLKSADKGRWPMELESAFRDRLGEEPEWEVLSEGPDKVWVTCASVDAVFMLIDHWCEALLDKSINRMVDYVAGGKQDKRQLDEAKAAVETALRAARGGVLREDLFLTYAAALRYSAPRVDNKASLRKVETLFEVGFLPEFKEKKWEWGAFELELEKLMRAINSRARAESGAVAPAVGSEARPLLTRVLKPATATPSLEELIERVCAAANTVGSGPEREKFTKAKKYAETYAHSLTPGNAAVEAAAEEIVEEVRESDGYALIKVKTAAELGVFASDPSFYLMSSVALFRDTREVNYLDFHEQVQKHERDYRDLYEEPPTLLSGYALTKLQEEEEEEEITVELWTTAVGR